MNKVSQLAVFVLLLLLFMATLILNPFFVFMMGATSMLLTYNFQGPMQL